tara:strand:- start:313 stop:489 length:177 start_codon:yes stop_codon:yes gene_type:complete
VALNLFQFNTLAQYWPEDPEYGTPEASATGEQAYSRYGAIAGKYIVGLGGTVIISTPE